MPGIIPLVIKQEHSSKGSVAATIDNLIRDAFFTAGDVAVQKREAASYVREQ